MQILDIGDVGIKVALIGKGALEQQVVGNIFFDSQAML